MAKRIIKEDTISHERWMVSYADFLTLLLAFFVVMYSVSQLNESKFRVLSQTLDKAFNIPQKSLKPIQIGEPVASTMPGVVEEAVESPEQKPASGRADEDEPKATTSEPQLPEEFKRISKRVQDEFRELMDRNLVSVHGNEEWLEIELKSSLLFASGDATPSRDASPIIAEMAAIVRDSQLPIRVEGFTDDLPIANDIYPSNWELSSARAASIVKMLNDGGVDPSRLAAVGYGEFQPVAANDSEAGRAANRRVVLMLSRNALLRPQLGRVEDVLGTGNAGQPVQQSAAVTDQSESPATGASESAAAPAPAAQAPESAAPEAGANIIRVELQGGGILFTNDPARGGAAPVTEQEAGTPTR